MSYSRYFKIAMAMAAYQHTNVRQNTTFRVDSAVLAAAGLNPICGASASGIIAATTSRAAVTNHFSCSRSAPDDPANRTTTAAALASKAAGTKMRTAVCDPGYHPLLRAVNGSAQTWQARATPAAAYSVNAAATNHAAGRHRRERSRPSGNSRNMKANPAAGIVVQAEFANQAAARAAGSDPGAATSPPRPYLSQKKPRPSTRPAPRKIQPTLFRGRLDVKMNPTTGTAMNVASSNTLEKFQRLRDPMCRSIYDSAIPAASSAPDTAATQPVAHRRIRAVIRAPRASCAAGRPASATHATTLCGASHLLSQSSSRMPPKARLRTARYRIVTATDRPGRLRHDKDQSRTRLRQDQASIIRASDTGPCP